MDAAASQEDAASCAKYFHRKTLKKSAETTKIKDLHPLIFVSRGGGGYFNLVQFASSALDFRGFLRRRFRGRAVEFEMACFFHSVFPSAFPSFSLREGI